METSSALILLAGELHLGGERPFPGQLGQLGQLDQLRMPHATGVPGPSGAPGTPGTPGPPGASVESDAPGVPGGLGPSGMPEASGVPGAPGALSAILAGPFAWVIGVDGGTRHALSLGLTPSIIIGDMDSIEPEVLAAFESVPRLRFPREKDKTDAQLAIEWALEQGARRIVLAGALGGRFDHTLANVHLLRLIRQRGADGLVTDGRQAVYLLEGSLELTAAPGTILSVLPIGPARGLTLTGLRWPLHGYDLLPGDTRTMSNEFTHDVAKLALTEGVALVVVHPVDDNP